MKNAFTLRRILFAVIIAALVFWLMQGLFKPKVEPIGTSEGFAMLEAVLIVATIAQQVRFNLEDGREVTPWPAITLRPAHGLPATVERRRK